MTRPQRTTPTELLPLVGLPADSAEAEAREAGYRVRTTCVDGVPRVITQDLRMDRINLQVEGGRVIAAYLG